MPDWTLISNHGLVLTYIAKHLRCTARELASAVKVTEWTVHRIISDLEKAKYIEKQKEGRKNVYRINPSINLRHETINDVRVGDLLKTLGWKQARK